MARLCEMNPDSETVYDSEISPLMAKILETCKKHKIPMVASFQYFKGDDDKGAGFCTSRIPFDGESPNLARAVDAIQAEPTFLALTISRGGK